MGFSIVVLENDPRIAQSLARKLSAHFNAVVLAHSSDELRERISRSKPEAVVLNIENSRLSDVHNLHNDFPSLPIVCLHRVPDEQMWVDALNAGASDVCGAEDARNVVSSVLHCVSAAKNEIAKDRIAKGASV
jgi:DNA-binding response OmpR family regulator